MVAILCFSQALNIIFWLKKRRYRSIPKDTTKVHIVNKRHEGFGSRGGRKGGSLTLAPPPVKMRFDMSRHGKLKYYW